MSDETTDRTCATGSGESITDCAETIRELDVFLDGELDDRHRDAIRHHLDGCMDCLGAYDFHAELKDVISKKCQNDEMPPDLLSRIEHCFGTDFDGDGQLG